MGPRLKNYHTEYKNDILHSDTAADKRALSFRYNNSVNQERDHPVLCYPMSTLWYKHLPEPASGCKLYSLTI
jgi:hypothetical protein